MELVNIPFTEPSVVFEFAVVGVCDVLQHMPLTTTAEPPSSVIFPPHEAVVAVKIVAEEVEITGIRAGIKSVT